MQAHDGPASELLHFLQRNSIQQRKAFQNTPYKLSRRFGRGLASLSTVGRNLLRHVPGLQKAVRPWVDQRTEGFRIFGFARQGCLVKLETLPCPLAPGFLEDPQSDDVL